MTPTVRRHRSLLGSALAMAAVIVTGCSTADPVPDRPPPPPRTPATEATVLSPPLTHLHGLHVTADRTLLAGTHTGLVAIDPAGTTAPVGTSDDDLMGLTGAPGTDLLFTSGHPGSASSGPNPLGVRVSSDGGTTWVDRSLSGQVDFHVLAAAGTLLIGSDGSAAVMVSVDAGRTWSAGAQLVPRTLAINADGIWAATEEGTVWHSTDNGRTFARIAAPTLALLAGNGAQALWAVDADGYSWQRFEGRAWRKGSWIGPTEALAVDLDGTAYAATSTTMQVLKPGT